jgi:hypothetical protein
MNFINKQTAKMGTAAERMVGTEFIVSKGYFPMMPAIEGPHPIDFVAMSGASTFNLDVKCKSKMVYIPFTGIDKKDVEKYNQLAAPTYLLFVDPASCLIYGQWLQRLNYQPHRIFPGGGNEEVMVWPLSAMTHYRYLSEEECNELKSLEQSNYR